MDTPIIYTKLYAPRPRHGIVVRQRLKDRLNDGLQRKLSLICGSAGYGKTTLVSAWLADCNRSVAWFSLDEADNEPQLFMSYLIKSFQRAFEYEVNILRDVSILLEAPQPPAITTITATIINELTRLDKHIILVLDDFHVIHSEAIHLAVSMLLEHMPPNLHVVLLSREEPNLQLHRLRVHDEVTEFGVQDLQFTYEETTLFLNDTMKLGLPSDAVRMLKERTEGWIAGLQIASLSIKGQYEAQKSNYSSLFPKDQRLLFNYLAQEVLLKQPAEVQRFLLYTSIFERFSASLCDAIIPDNPSLSRGDQILHRLERSNLFIVPQDDEQCWYRYHHLFAKLLRQQLLQRIESGEIEELAVLHQRAAVWFEGNGLYLEAFRHAAAANNIPLAARLAEGEGLPLHLQGGAAPVLNWLESLPRAELNGRPSLWVIYGSVLLMFGKLTEVESKLLAAETALPSSLTAVTPNNQLGIIATTRATLAAMTFSGHSSDAELKLALLENTLQLSDSNDKTNELVGHIVSANIPLELDSKQVDEVIHQCQLALKYLDAELLPIRMTALWMLGYAYQFKKKFSEAQQAYIEVLSLSRKMGGSIIEAMANVGLGSLMESENKLTEAEACYSRAVSLNGDLPLPAICDAYLGLARICYEENNIENSLGYVKKSKQLAQLAESKEHILSSEAMLKEIEKSMALEGVPNLQLQYLINRQQQSFGTSEEGYTLIEPLTQREHEVLQMIAQGYSNQEIGNMLFLALDTVKGHNRRIFAKLQVERRTEAVAVARKLGMIEQ